MACRTAPMDSTCLPEMPRRAFLAIVAGGFLAAPLVAEGQPAGKVWRIGAVVGSDVNYAAFLQGCVRQVGSRGGTRRSSVVLSRASRRGFPPWLRRLSRSRSTSPSPPPASNPKLPEGNERHSHRGARSRKRSSGERVRGEPRATRGKPHRRLPGSAGGQWQTASVAQGNAARSGAGGRAVGTGRRGAAAPGHRGGGASGRRHSECARHQARRGGQTTCDRSLGWRRSIGCRPSAPSQVFQARAR